MRIILATLILLSSSTLALAQPAKTPEQLLPADCVAYLRYDGYAPHRKAYDQTALAKVMKEGLGDFLDHGFSQLFTLAGDDFPPRNLKKGEGRRLAVDRFLEHLWQHGFAAALEFVPQREKVRAEDLVQLTIVFPQGAQKKKREALENLFRFLAAGIETKIVIVKHGGRARHSLSFGAMQAHWWPEGEHLVLTLGTQSSARAMQVIDGRRPNLTSAKWHAELIGFKSYETDIRGYLDIEAVVNRSASFGLDEPGLANLKERFSRQVFLGQVGLGGLKQLTFHLGFDGKYQRSTVRLGVVEPERRAGFLRLLSGSIAFDVDKLPPLPPDADYVSVRPINWASGYDFIRSSYTLVALSQLFNGQFAVDEFPDLDRLLGIDFRKDFLDQLDTTLVSWGAHSEGPFFVGQGFAVKIKDAAKVRKSLQAITKVLAEADANLASEKKMYRGHELQVFTKLSLTYTIHNDWLVFGFLPQPVQGVILRSSGKYRVWKAPPELAVALSKQAGKSNLVGVSVSDPRPAIEIGLSLMPVFVQYVNAFAGTRVLDVNEIPNAQAINEWLFPNIALTYDDGNAIRWEHLYSINEPDDLLAVQLLSYGASFNRNFLPFRFPVNEAPAMKPMVVEKGSVPVNGVLCPATAVEKDGVVHVQIAVTREVAVYEIRKVPVTVVQKVVVKGKTKEVQRTEYVEEKVTSNQTVRENLPLIADGKNVRITRKDGKAVDPKELPMLLKEETQVLLVLSGAIHPAVLQKLDERMLIIRVAP